MTIQEAIRFLEPMALTLAMGHHQCQKEAIKLGIEALKYVIFIDNCPGLSNRLLLPGETEE